MRKILLPALLLLVLRVSASCPDHCIDCSQETQSCYACSDGYQLAIMGDCIQQSTFENCALFGPFNTCFQCNPTYQLTNGTCEKVYTGCIIEDTTPGQCLSCSFGTNLINNVCSGAINCRVGNGTCTECQLGFELLNETCIDHTGNCKQKNQIGLCEICNEGYSLIGYECISANVTPFGCVLFLKTGECISCKNGFSLYEGYCLLQWWIDAIHQGQQSLPELLVENNLTFILKQNKKDNQTDNMSLHNIENKTINSNSTQGTSNPGMTSQNEGVVIISLGSVNQSAAQHQVNEDNITAVIQNQTDANNGTHSQPELNISKLLNSSTQSKPIENNNTHFNHTTSSSNENIPQDESLPSNSTISMINSKQPLTIPFCTVHNGDICSNCSLGYYLSNNNCLKIEIINCIAAGPSGNCNICINGYILSEGVCTFNFSLNTNCQSFNLNTGDCIYCIPGYLLFNNTCVQFIASPPPPPPPPPPPTPSPPPTPQAPMQAAVSLSPTFIAPSSAQSVLSVSIQPSSSIVNKDPNCVNYSNGICKNCSKNYYLSSIISSCVPVNPQCNTYNPQNGDCLTCFPGYTVLNGQCIIGSRADFNCKTSANGICIQCFSGYYYSIVYNKCIPLNPLCKTSNISDGTCLSCYPGYSLNYGQCIPSQNDPNCKQINISTNLCQQCFNNYYLDANSKCKQVSSLCKTYNSSTGSCLSCYSGYTIINGICSVSSLLTSPDINCLTFNNGICIKCYNGYLLNSSNKCIENNPICKTVNTSNGQCTSCYPGYALSLGNCPVSNKTTNSADPNCRFTDPTGLCTECFKGHYLSAGKTCTSLDPLCKTYTQLQSACTSCYDGYALVKYSCVLSVQSNVSSDPYCISTQNGACIACASGYYLNQLGTCLLINPSCKSIDTVGNCISCYQGYYINNGICALDLLNVPYCSTYANGTCTLCINGYYLSNGACEVVSLLCATYNPSTGACLSCNTGYVLQSGECIYPSMGIDIHCTQYSGSYCSQCEIGLTLSNYICVDPNCFSYDLASNACLICANDLTPQGFTCK